MRPGSCARVTGTRTNDTAAALPMRAMNSRRLMASSPCGDRAKYIEIYHISERAGRRASQQVWRPMSAIGPKHKVAALQPAARGQEPRGR